MPELPEVEVVRRGLSAWIPRREVEAVEVLDDRSLRRHAAGRDAFVRQLTGTRMGEPQRRGKYLWIPLTRPNGGDQDGALVVHLGMSGQMLVDTTGTTDQPHLRIRLLLSSPPEPHHRPDDVTPLGELRFVDQRIFGGLYLDRLIAAPDGAPELIPSTVAHIARDPLDPRFSLDAFHTRLRRRTSELKRALLDQSLISGIGNIYADEALWRARLHYRRRTETINRTESARLIDAVEDVMTQALAEGGTSFDSLYVNVNGASGYFDRSLQVYGRAGQPCRRCAEQGRETLIRREKFMNRSSAFCPVCQPTPRALRSSPRDSMGKI